MSKNAHQNQNWLNLQRVSNSNLFTYFGCFQPTCEQLTYFRNVHTFNFQLIFIDVTSMLQTTPLTVVSVCVCVVAFIYFLSQQVPHHWLLWLDNVWCDWLRWHCRIKSTRCKHFSSCSREMGTQLEVTGIYSESLFMIWPTSRWNQSGKQWVENTQRASYKPLAY